MVLEGRIREMSERRWAYAAIFAAVVLVAVSIIVVIAAQPAQARDVEPDWTWKVAPSDKTNKCAVLRMKMDGIGDKVKEAIEEYEAEQAALEAEQEAYWETYYEPTYYAPSYVQGDPDGLNSFVGVVDYNGTTETAYSSNVLYHYRTSEWTPDEYGFYRTSDGYYVVASNDYEEGTVIETSRGEAMVLDGGCDSGVVDFYTNW